MDLIPGDGRRGVLAGLVAELGWSGVALWVSAETGQGTQALCRRIMSELEAMRQQEATGDE
jgi:GTP-binding protein